MLSIAISLRQTVIRAVRSEVAPPAPWVAIGTQPRAPDRDKNLGGGLRVNETPDGGTSRAGEKRGRAHGRREDAGVRELRGRPLASPGVQSYQCGCGQCTLQYRSSQAPKTRTVVKQICT